MIAMVVLFWILMYLAVGLPLARWMYVSQMRRYKGIYEYTDSTDRDDAQLLAGVTFFLWPAVIPVVLMWRLGSHVFERYVFADVSWKKGKGKK